MALLSQLFLQPSNLNENAGSSDFSVGQKVCHDFSIDNPYEGGKSGERHGVVPESSGDCVPVDR